jgi:membrane-bound serine protease (ClpP class)
MREHGFCAITLFAKIKLLSHFLTQSVGCIIEGVIVWAASFAFGVAQGLRAQRLPVKVGTETMLGKTVNALTPINARAGKVFIEGEYWNATSDTPVEKGQPVQITAVEGLMIKVKPET